MIVSIDQSLSSSGVIIWEEGKHKHWKLIKTKPKAEAIIRIREIIDAIRDLVKLHKVTHITVESLPYGANSPSVRPLAALYYFISNLCIELNITFADANVTAVKKLATGSGNASKEDMIAAFTQAEPDLYELIIKSGVKKTTGLADLADAYFIGSFHNKKDKIEK